jgi:hypothetical protein
MGFSTRESHNVLLPVRERNAHIGLYTVKAMDSQHDGNDRSLRRKGDLQSDAQSYRYNLE